MKTSSIQKAPIIYNDRGECKESASRLWRDMRTGPWTLHHTRCNISHPYASSAPLVRGRDEQGKKGERIELQLQITSPKSTVQRFFNKYD